MWFLAKLSFFSWFFLEQSHHNTCIKEKDVLSAWLSCIHISCSHILLMSPFLNIFKTDNLCPSRNFTPTTRLLVTFSQYQICLRNWQPNASWILRRGFATQAFFSSCLRGIDICFLIYNKLWVDICLDSPPTCVHIWPLPMGRYQNLTEILYLYNVKINGGRGSKDIVV